MRISPPRLSFTRVERCVPALRKRRAISGPWPLISLRPWEQILAKLADRDLPLTHQPLTHTDRRVLAEPFKDNKKPGWGQRIQPHPSCRFHPTTGSFSAPMPHSRAQNRLLSSCSACCPGCAQCPAAPGGTPVRFTPSVYLPTLEVPASAHHLVLEIAHVMRSQVVGSDGRHHDRVVLVIQACRTPFNHIASAGKHNCLLPLWSQLEIGPDLVRIDLRPIPELRRRPPRAYPDR